MNLIRKYLNLEYLLVGIQLFFSAVITFFHASGWQFPFSVLLLFNSGIYFLLYGRRLRNIVRSPIGMTFFLLVVIIIISSANYLYYDDLRGFLLHDANLFELFSFSLIWALNFFVIFIFSSGNKSLDLIKLFSWLFLVISIYANIRAYQYNRVLVGSQIQYHYYYYLVMIIPLLILANKNSKIKYVFILIALVATVFSFKRMGIFIGFLLIIFNIFYDLNTIPFRKKFQFIVFIILIISLVYMSLPQMQYEAERVLLRMSRLQDDAGSGRLDYAFDVLNNFSLNTAENKLIGNGFWSMYIEHKHFVDVEWASMLHYFGIIGLSIYVLIHFLMIIRLSFLLKTNNIFFVSFLNFYIIFLLYSIATELFSYQYLSVPLFIYLGLMEGSIAKTYLKGKNNTNEMEF